MLTWEAQEADLNEQLKQMKSSWERAKSPVVTGEDIAEVVAMWTGVPVMQIAEAESKRLLKMEDELAARSLSARKKPSNPSPRQCAARAPG